MFLALLRAHFNPRYARAKMTLSRIKNIFMPANVNSIVILIIFMNYLYSNFTQLYNCIQLLHINYIAVRPTVTVNCSSFITVNEEDDITCVCRGKGGNPPANVTWYKDGVQVGETGKEEQTLIRRNISEADNGMYTCVAQSHIDMTDKKSIKVTINCKSMIQNQPSILY